MTTSSLTFPYLASSAEYRPDRFYRYAELTAVLERWAAERPDLCTLASIGQTYQGREIWCMTVTRRATGAPEDKPAYFIDGNIHAGEVTGSAVALYTIRRLLDGDGHDPLVTRLLDTRTFYIVPRVSADGAEVFLSGPESLRASLRPYPEAPAQPGFRREDVDGDGLMLTMRVKDPNGPWKVSARDPRVMIARSPDEVGGDYYRLLPEGVIEGFDPARELLGAIAPPVSPFGLDLNRNFPANWQPGPKGGGGGASPLTEPETRALADFLLGQPNITGSQHYHTFSGVILRPSSVRRDLDWAPQDLARYQAIGRLGTEETGYPCIAIFEDFLEDPREPLYGLLLDWAWDHLGLITFSTEVWNLAKAVGVSAADKPLDFYFGQGRSEDDEIAMLDWIDRHLGGYGFVPWRSFRHPQLGEVELGGWLYKQVIQNVPGPLLEAECERNCRFTLRAAAASPRLVIAETRVEALAEGLYRVQAVVENEGYLTTSVTDRAAAIKAVRTDRVRLRLDEGVELVSGEAELELGFVPGRDVQTEPPKFSVGYGVPQRRKLEWLVRGTPGASLTIESDSRRGGRDVRRLSL